MRLEFKRVLTNAVRMLEFKRVLTESVRIQNEFEPAWLELDFRIIILALHELKQIRCTGRADSSRAYLDLRQPPETFDAFLKMPIPAKRYAIFRHL